MEGHHPDFHLTSYRNIQVAVLHGAEVVSSQTQPICPYFLGGDSDSPDCETNSRNTILSQFLTWRLFVWPLMGMKFNLDLLRETWVLMTSEWAPSYTIQVSSKPSFTIDINGLQARVVSFSMALGFVKSRILVFSIFFHVFPCFFTDLLLMLCSGGPHDTCHWWTLSAGLCASRTPVLGSGWNHPKDAGFWLIFWQCPGKGLIFVFVFYQFWYQHLNK